MRNYLTIAGEEKFARLVAVNGTTALARDAKPSGKLMAVVKGTDDETGKITYYLVIKNDTTFGIYATQVEREIEKIVPLFSDTMEIECTEGVSRKSNQKFFKIVVTNL